MGCGKDVLSPRALSMSAALKPWHGVDLQLEDVQRECMPSFNFIKGH